MQDLVMNSPSRLSEELAVFRRLIASRFRRSSVAGSPVYLIENFLPQDVFEQIQTVAIQEKDNLFRKNSGLRSGAALSSEELRKGPCIELFEALVNPDTLDRVRKTVDIEHLEFVHLEDTNQLSLLYYGVAGDGIGWHFDGNIYLGDRWAGIFTLQEETLDEHCKLEMQQDGGVKNFPAKLMPNSLALFQGDQVKHRVRAMNDGEERMVINLLFSTNPVPSKNPLLTFYQTVVNYFFYGKAKP